jgi:hypothetical protein
MHANDGGVDHLHVAFVARDNGVHQAIPDAGFSPSVEAIIDRRRRAVALRQVGPGRTRPQNIENAVQHTTVINALDAARLVGKMRLNRVPLKVSQIIAASAHRKTPVWELESQPSRFENPRYAFMSLRPKAY